MQTTLSAAICIIGDEILSGRTRDINVLTLARFLRLYGIPVSEVRIVSDVHSDIVDAVNALRGRYTYVFTTGGIGPTHDDITADAIAAAFEVGISEHPEIIEMLAERYAQMDTDFTPARRRMARIPHGASLIANPVSGAPGFQTGNVFTLAGVPKIVEAMLDDIGHRLQSGALVHSLTISGAGLREGDIAEALGDLAAQYDTISLGSYPWFNSLQDNGVALVARSTDRAALEQAGDALETLVRTLGVQPERLTDAAV